MSVYFVLLTPLIILSVPCARGRTATMKAAVFHNYNPDREDYRQTLKDVRPDAKGRGVAGRWLRGNDWPLETEQSSDGEQQRQEASGIWNRVQPREFGEVFLLVVFSALHSLLVAAHSWPQKNKGERLSNIVMKLATLHVIFLIVFCTYPACGLLVSVLAHRKVEGRRLCVSGRTMTKSG